MSDFELMEHSDINAEPRFFGGLAGISSYLWIGFFVINVLLIGGFLLDTYLVTLLNVDDEALRKEVFLQENNFIHDISKYDKFVPKNDFFPPITNSLLVNNNVNAPSADWLSQLDLGPEDFINIANSLDYVTDQYDRVKIEGRSSHDTNLSVIKHPTTEISPDFQPNRVLDFDRTSVSKPVTIQTLLNRQNVIKIPSKQIHNYQKIQRERFPISYPIQSI